MMQGKLNTFKLYGAGKKAPEFVDFRRTYMLSENEYKILSLMWREGKPITRAEILKGTEGRNWNPSSIHLILNAMISKHVIKITDEKRTYGRTYEPVISYQEYLIETLKTTCQDRDLMDILEDLKEIRDTQKEGNHE